MATIITNVTELQAMGISGDYELGNDIDASATATWNQLNDRGAWAPYTAYSAEIYDFVTYNGNNYYCKTTHTSEATFQASKWYLTSLAGDGYLGFEPIGLASAFTGTFDGKGYTISGLYIHRDSQDVGLFVRTNGASLSNINLSGIDITGKNTGGLVCYAENTDIDNCSVNGSIEATYIGGLLASYFYDSFLAPTMNRCSSSGGSSGNDIGGLIGWIGGDLAPILIECSSSASVNGTHWAGGLIGYTQRANLNKCFATGDVTSDDIAGGFIAKTCWGGGTKLTELTDCYAQGNVHAVNDAAGFICAAGETTILDNCYSIGLVQSDEGEDYEYGFIGGIATVNDCFWDTETSGTILSDGGTGKTTEEMQTLATFAAWDIGESETDLGNGYPFLSWQLGSSPIWLLGEERPIALAIAGINITETTATLFGKIVDDDGAPCEYRFRYKKEGDPGYSYTVWANGKVTDDTFSKNITNLIKATLYEFAAQAQNAMKIGNWSASKFFMTLSPRKTTSVDDIVTLEAVRNIEMAAQGRFYTDAEGNAVYKSRYGRNP